MHKKMVIAMGIMLGVLASSTPTIQNNISPMTITVYAEDTTPVYDTELSLVSIKPQSGGKTYFSYKINGEYPTYSKDKVCFFNADGSLKEEKENMQGQSIFTDDISTWIDVTKTTPKVSPDSEYYNRMRAGDSDVVLPYSEENKTNEFYIPVEEIDTKVTINVVNVADDGTVSEVQSSDFQFSGVSQASAEGINATISSVTKNSSSETVRISGDNISYVQVGSEIYSASNNSVDIKLTSNGEVSFLVYGADTATPEVLNYTVEGLQALVDKNIVNEKVDKKKPIITTDKIPSKKQDKAIKFKVYTDEPCTISCNGVSSEGTELELIVAGNGKYVITATDKSGNYSKKTIKFNCFIDIVNEYELDRDKQWGTSSTSETVTEGTLPKTGGIGWITMIGTGLAGIGVGSYLLKKGRKEENVKN